LKKTNELFEQESKPWARPIPTMGMWKKTGPQKKNVVGNRTLRESHSLNLTLGGEKVI